MSYREMGERIGSLVDQKNKAYGNSFHNSDKMLRVLYPNGLQPDQYKDMLGIIRVVDKLFRIAHSRDAFGENPWADIAGYGLLGADNADNDEKTTGKREEGDRPPSSR
jgi:hypothetical protein